MLAESDKAPSLCKSKFFLRKVSFPVTSYLRARSTQGYKTDPHLVIFPECCHNFWVLKSSLFVCRWSQTQSKSKISIGKCSSVKAAHGYKKSSPSYQSNSLNFGYEKIAVITVSDHLNNLFFKTIWMIPIKWLPIENER